MSIDNITLAILVIVPILLIIWAILVWLFPREKAVTNTQKLSFAVIPAIIALLPLIIIIATHNSTISIKIPIPVLTIVVVCNFTSLIWLIFTSVIRKIKNQKDNEKTCTTVANR
jgi:hypothetical protein